MEKILFEKEGNTTRAVGVQLAASENAPKYTVKARKEVILSAGAISSPHILFVSGIGSSEELKSAGVPMVKNLPAVGKHLLDVSVIFAVLSLSRSSLTRRTYSIWRPDQESSGRDQPLRSTVLTIIPSAPRFPSLDGSGTEADHSAG